MSKLKFLLSLLFLISTLQVFAQREDVGNYEYDKEYLLEPTKTLMEDSLEAWFSKQVLELPMINLPLGN